MAISLLAAVGCTNAPQTFSEVIEADLVSKAASSRASGRTIILDVRSASDYGQRHIENAVHVDPIEWMQASLSAESGIEDVDAWERRIGAVGIDNDDRVFIYDDGNMKDAARIWFILQHFGVRKAAVVNGGWPAVQPLIDGGRIRGSTTPTVAKPQSFKARVSADAAVALLDREGTREAVARSSMQILDVRTAGEYRGEITHRNPRGGHLPGAHNLPHAELLTPDGRLRSPEELAALFERAGITKGEPIVAHCESGGRSSLAALAAVRAGYGPVKNYYHSFSDWSTDATCPVVADSNP